MAYGPPLLACNTFLPTSSQHSWLYHNSVICIYCIRIFYISGHALLHTHHCIMVVSLLHILLQWLCQLVWCPSTSTSAVLMLSTRSGFSHFFHRAMLPRTLISIDVIPCTVSTCYAHATGPPQRPTYLPPGHTPSTLAGTKSDRDTHNAWIYSLLYTWHHHLPISGLARGFGRGISWAMPH